MPQSPCSLARSRHSRPARTRPNLAAQEIAEIQKQLANLEKKLARLEKGTPATTGTRKPVTLAEAETWRSIRGASLSPDGTWFAHRVGPAEGKAISSAITRNGKETKFAGGSGFGQMQFSLDSKWFGFSYSPYTKAGTTPPGPRPKSKIVLVKLADGKTTEIEGADSFHFSGEAATHIAYRKVVETAPAHPPRRRGRAAPRHNPQLPQAVRIWCCANWPRGSTSCWGTWPISTSTRRAAGSSP